MLRKVESSAYKMYSHNLLALVISFRYIIHSRGPSWSVGQSVSRSVSRSLERGQRGAMKTTQLTYEL